MQNLQGLPRSLSQAHRWALFKVVLNAVPTGRRYRFLDLERSSQCMFCAGPEDSLEHYCCCHAVKGCFEDAVIAVMGDLEFGRDVLMLETPLGGDSLQTVAAFWHALLKARAALAKGLSFNSQANLQRYFFRCMQHPWLLGGTASLTKRERRSRRVAPPQPLEDGTMLYRSDGACRRQGNTGDRQASFGAIRWEGSRVVGRKALPLGDSTNNAAEYYGLIACLQDSVRRLPRRVAFQLDSLLVARQVSGTWKCRSPELTAYYEEALDLIAFLRRNGCAVALQHIFREFNAEADGLAKAILDGQLSVSDSWLA